jgi:very-short-patch-repair endonuclease
VTAAALPRWEPVYCAQHEGGPSDYAAFIERKSQATNDSGFAPVWMPEFLFDFQRSLVEWALRKGSAELCELGAGVSDVEGCGAAGGDGRMVMGKFAGFVEALDRCESQIETSFLAALLFFGDYTFEPYVGPPVIARDKTGVDLLQQVQVGKHRIDFGLTRIDAPVRLAIELDGHAFHGSSPDQFARDKARERALTGLGWTFLRFSGQEVWRDPRKCAAEAMARAATLLVPGDVRPIDRAEAIRRVRDALHRNDAKAHAAALAELGRLAG